jgi:hypothetical protein
MKHHINLVIKETKMGEQDEEVKYIDVDCVECGGSFQVLDDGTDYTDFICSNCEEDIQNEYDGEKDDDNE